MKTKLVGALCLVLLGCDMNGVPNTGEDCREFPYKTTHNGAPVTCEVLWCNRGNLGDSHMGSGMAVLWCDGPAATAAGGVK
jgi:hypothetical protein